MALTAAGRVELAELVARGGRRPQYMVDQRTLGLLEKLGYVKQVWAEFVTSGHRVHRQIEVVITDAGRRALDDSDRCQFVGEKSDEDWPGLHIRCVLTAFHEGPHCFHGGRA